MPPSKVCPSCSFQNSPAKGFCDQCGEKLDGNASGPGLQLSPRPSAPRPPETRSLGLPHTSIIRPGKPAAAPAPPPAAPARAAIGPGPEPIRPPGPTRRGVRSIRLALAFLLAGLAAWGYRQAAGAGPEREAAAAAGAYLAALKAGDADRAYRLLTERARRLCSPADFKRILEASRWDFSDLGRPAIDGGSAVLRYRLSAAGRPPEDAVLTLRREAEGWRRPFAWPALRDVEDAFDRGDAAGALWAARAAQETDPGDPAAQASICEALHALRDPAMEAACLAALAQDRRAPPPLSLGAAGVYRVRAILAAAYKDALGKPREAVEQYTALLLAGGASPADQCEALLGRAESRGTLGDTVGAAQDLTRAAGVCPEPPDAEYARRAATLYAAQPQEPL